MKKRQIPHTYVIIFYIILFCAILTWVIPGGQYTESISPDGERTVVYESVESVPQTWEVLSAFYKGFVDKADIIVFILIIGGAFWIVNDSKAFDIGTVSFLRKARKMENNPILRKIGVDNFLLTAIMLLFSLFGAVFGMSEETIAFCLVLVPMAISMGYDSITGVCMVFIAAGLGFAGAILNPFTIGIAQGLAAGIANGRDPNELVKLFLEGCKDIMSAALVVGLAGGIIVILQDGKVIDTILFNLAKGMEGLGQVATVGMMYVIQTLINLVIPSGSAKAALTMPIMAPFSELIGLSKQATVMAFQFGDGFTNLITPTSGVLIAVLGVSRIPYDKWFKWAWKFILVLVILGFLLLIPTVLIPMNGF